MEEKKSTTRENPSPDDSATVLHGHSPTAHIAPGSRVGHYTIREVLGEGGFAVVYLAEQTEPVRRRVALKVIKLGMDTKQVLARFEAERQALAMMDHPNVAKVFDAGVTDDGRSYFVMEHVPGVPITDHCDRQRLNIEQRLQLFMSVCDAVQHAHQKGIIHRDLKPGNVLVSAKEGSAVPKVIDFGVAKALHQKLTEKTLFTEQGQLIGTPEYMSPEQAEMTAQDIDTRSDIYSLGVLLYELLTGVLPFDPMSLRTAAFAEIQRIIREEEPPKPSTKLSSLGDASSTNADNRRLDTRSLMRELRGDLDWIVMKAMEKDRQRRYETANALAMDLQRHLTHEPVLAGPPSAAYRMSKFMRRNRGGVFAAGVVLGVLILGVVGTTWGWLEALDAHDAESEARAEAQQRAKELEQVTEFQASMFGDIDAWQMGRNIFAALRSEIKEGITGKNEREALLTAFDRGVWRANATDLALRVIAENFLSVAAKTIETQFVDQPLIRAALQQSVANTYLEIGLYEPAIPLQEAALRTCRAELGPEHPDTLAAMNNLAILDMKLGRFDEAESLHVKTLGIMMRVLGEEHPSTLASKVNLAASYMKQGRYDEAESLYLTTLEVMKRVLGEEHQETLASMVNLAALYMKQGRYDEAEPLYLTTLEVMKRVLGEEHPSTLDSMHNLADMYQSQARYDEAEPLYLTTLETMKRVLGEEHQSTLASMGNLAALYMKQVRFSEAESLYVKALEIMQRVVREEHPSRLASMVNLAILYKNQGRYDEAEPLYVKTLEIMNRVLGEEHPNTLFLMMNLAKLYVEQERFEEADALQTQAVATSRRAWPEGAWFIGAFRGDHGRTLLALHRYRDAEAALVEGHEILNDGLGSTHERTISAIKSLSDLYTAWHEAEPDKGYDTKAAEWRAKLPEPDESAPDD